MYAIKTKYWAGEVCPKTATYGQYNDSTNAYAGISYDRFVQAGNRFPPSLNNHNYQEK